MKKVICLVIIILSTHSCSEKKIQKDPLDNPSEYYEIQGQVYKTIDYWDWRYLETSRDIFYEYHFDKNPPLKGEMKHTTLFGLHTGDLISVIVNKKDIHENYYNGPAVIDSILEFDRYDKAYEEFLKKKKSSP